MDTLTFKSKRRRLTISLAILGLAIAAVIWAYSELTDSSPPRPLNFPLWTVFMILCPPTFLSIPLIDVEPGSGDFAIMWLVIGLANSALYAAIGAIVGRFCWNSDDQTTISRN